MHNISKSMGYYETVLRGTFIALRAYIKKVEKVYTSNLAAHLKALEQKVDSPRRSR